MDQNESPLKIVPDTKYPNMYRLEWKDSSKSIRYFDPENPLEDRGPNTYGIYNLTRASDILRNYKRYIADMKARQELEGVASLPSSPVQQLFIVPR